MRVFVHVHLISLGQGLLGARILPVVDPLRAVPEIGEGHVRKRRQCRSKENKVNTETRVAAGLARAEGKRRIEANFQKQ
jgi:hypothetical protein